MSECNKTNGLDVVSALATLSLTMVEVQKRLDAVEKLSNAINTGAAVQLKSLVERVEKLEPKEEAIPEVAA